MEYFETKKNDYNFILGELSKELYTSITTGTFYDSVILIMINYEKNKEDLSRMVHRRFLEFAVVPRWKGFRDDGKGVFYIGISDEFVKAFYIDIDKLFESAYKNTLEKTDLMIKSVESFIDNSLCSGDSILDFDSDESDDRLTDELYMVTNTRVEYGAVYLYVKEVIEDIYEKLGKNFYIILSSVNEFLVFGEMPSVDLDYLKNLIRNVNEEILLPKEFLSDNLYYYDGYTKELSII
ncbi:MAG: hypothetical protein IKS48_04170 [Eubacterium sp.]|nr:hypothetical protein [Eubacterium sp.]